MWTVTLLFWLQLKLSIPISYFHLSRINTVTLINSWHKFAHTYTITRTNTFTHNQRCCQIEISPEFGSYLGAFWLLLPNKNGKVLCNFFKIGIFLEDFLGAFDKYLEILCFFRELFQCFSSIWKLFWAFLTNFENSTEILWYFLKLSNLGDLLKFGSRRHLCLQSRSCISAQMTFTLYFASCHLLFVHTI